MSSVNVRPRLQTGEDAIAVRPRASSSKRSIRLRLYAVLLAVDLACILLSFALGAATRFGDYGDAAWMNIAIAIMPIYAGTALNSGAYTISVLRSPDTGIVRALGAFLFAIGSLLLISYLLRVEQEVSRLSLTIAIFSTMLSLTITRKLLGTAIRKSNRNNFTTEVVIGDGLIVETPPEVSFIDAEANDLAANIRDPMMLHRLAKCLEGVDRVVIACRPESIREWAMLLKGANICGEVLTSEFDEVGALGVNSMSGRTTLVVATGPLNLRNRMIKRALDLAFAVPALILLAPVLVVAAIAIKLDSKGPVFFRQQRVGRGNALFEVYKFRSMRVDSCDGAGNQSTRRDDDRVTRVGRFIRRTSIDELPQLLNVFFGSMSLVGPRPHALGSLAGQELFWEVDERYWHRHALKPGITGLAQVRGFRGATHQRDDLTRRLQADLEYVSGWSVWRDIAILLSTFRVIVHSNAY